jgi:hypothetical protein
MLLCYSLIMFCVSCLDLTENLNCDIFVCFDVMYSGEYNVFDVTLSVNPHRAG